MATTERLPAADGFITAQPFYPRQQPLSGVTDIANKTRILLSCRPKLLLEVIRKLIEKQADMDVVGEAPDPMDLLRVARTAQAEAVIITPLETSGDTNICRHLLASHPALRVVSLSENGKMAYLHRHDVPKSRIDEDSGRTILDAIVDAIRQHV